MENSAKRERELINWLTVVLYVVLSFSLSLLFASYIPASLLSFPLTLDVSLKLGNAVYQAGEFQVIPHLLPCLIVFSELDTSSLLP